jgi:hypothetical protein
MFIFRRLWQRRTGNKALDRQATASQRFLQTETRSKNSHRVTTLLCSVTRQQSRFAYHLVVNPSHSSCVVRDCRAARVDRIWARTTKRSEEGGMKGKVRGERKYGIMKEGVI